LLAREDVPRRASAADSRASFCASRIVEHLGDLPQGVNRRYQQHTAAQRSCAINRPDLKIVPIRGNVPTRLRKLAQQQ
jgi:porphobilinogen deaminase